MSLHTVTDEVRNVVKWASIVIGTILILFLVFKVGLFIKNILFPEKPSPPTVAFGKLKSISFPQNTNNRTFTYKLNTTTGTLPVFPDRMSVYKIIPPQPSLNALKNATEKAKAVGFDQSPASLTKTRFQWSIQAPPFKFLAMDIISFNFELSSQFLSDQNVLSANSLPNEQAAINSARDFLSRLGLFYLDIDDSKTKTTLLDIQNSELVPATSLSTSKLIQVDFYQKDLDKHSIFYSNPPFSSMSFLVASGERNADVVRGNFFHQTIDTTIKATYPIKTAEVAFDILQKGNAYIAAYYGKGSQISITNVLLGYYLGEQEQDYLMPIVVFQGDNGFFAYVPAIQDEWITNQ